MAEIAAATQQSPNYHSNALEVVEKIGGAALSGLATGGAKAALINGGLAAGKVLFDETVYQYVPNLAKSSIYQYASKAGDVLLTSAGPLMTKGRPQAFTAATSALSAQLSGYQPSDENTSESESKQTSLWDVTVSSATRVVVGMFWQSSPQANIAESLSTPAFPTNKAGVGSTLSTLLLATVGSDIASKVDPFRSSPAAYAQPLR